MRTGLSALRHLEASLRRLNTDYVDVFMPHFPDGTTPAEEILAGLDDLIRSGKVLHGGLSNFPARAPGLTWRSTCGRLSWNSASSTTSSLTR
jgi:aryl-alcohol dehydrogenase-like predicted oxidoreductase